MRGPIRVPVVVMMAPVRERGHRRDREDDQDCAERSAMARRHAVSSSSPTGEANAARRDALQRAVLHALRAGQCRLALGAVDGRGDPARAGDPDEAEIAVVGAGGVEVDRADAQEPVAEALLGVDVLDAVDARLLDLLAEDPAADVEPLVVTM